MDKIQELKALLASLRCNRLRYQVLKAQANEMTSIAEAMTGQQRRILQLLEELDCKSSSNFGWEQRIISLLLELPDNAVGNTGTAGDRQE